MIACMRHLRFDGGMPRDPYIREKYTWEVKTARALARNYFLNVFPRIDTKLQWRVGGTCSEWPPHRNVPDAHSPTNVS
jgi:hypothetical protein